MCEIGCELCLTDEQTLIDLVEWEVFACFVSPWWSALWHFFKHVLWRVDQQSVIEKPQVVDIQICWIRWLNCWLCSFSEANVFYLLTPSFFFFLHLDVERHTILLDADDPAHDQLRTKIVDLITGKASANKTILLVSLSRHLTSISGASADPFLDAVVGLQLCSFQWVKCQTCCLAGVHLGFSCLSLSPWMTHQKSGWQQHHEHPCQMPHLQHGWHHAEKWSSSGIVWVVCFFWRRTSSSSLCIFGQHWTVRCVQIGPWLFLIMQHEHKLMPFPFFSTCKFVQTEVMSSLFRLVWSHNF